MNQNSKYNRDANNDVNPNVNPNANLNAKHNMTVAAFIADSTRTGTGHEEMNYLPKPKIHQVDSRDLNENSIKNLKIRDPFMYYSIPGVRKADILVREIKHSDVDALMQGFPVRQGHHQGRREAGMSAGDNTLEGTDIGTIVHRKSRHSTECHVSLIMQDILFGNE